MTAFKLICVLKPDANPVVDSSTFSDLRLLVDTSSASIVGLSVGISTLFAFTSTSGFVTSMTLFNVDIGNSQLIAMPSSNVNKLKCK